MLEEQKATQNVVTMLDELTLDELKLATMLDELSLDIVLDAIGANNVDTMLDELRLDTKLDGLRQYLYEHNQVLIKEMQDSFASQIALLEEAIKVK